MIVGIRLDHGVEFENASFNQFFNELGINHNFSTPKTPQQNSFIDKKNKTLVDIARTMLIDTGIIQNFLVELINIAFYVINRCLSRSILNNTPYELMNKRKPKLNYFKHFGCNYFVLYNGKMTLENLTQEVMKEFLLGILQPTKLTESITK